MSNSSNQCPICDEGTLQPLTLKTEVEYREQSGEIDLCFSFCSACGSEQANAEQLYANKLAWTEFKEHVDTLLDAR